jgi:hypothetical protein
VWTICDRIQRRGKESNGSVDFADEWISETSPGGCPTSNLLLTSREIPHFLRGDLSSDFNDTNTHITVSAILVLPALCHSQAGLEVFERGYLAKNNFDPGIVKFFNGYINDDSKVN